ncbi:MAG: hypothetical protein WAZ94_13425 [Phycisphaerales bacterium]
MSSLTSTAVETAIRHILAGGQEYQLPDGKRVRQANLTELVQLRDKLATEESAASGGGMLSPIQFRGAGTTGVRGA